MQVNRKCVTHDRVRPVLWQQPDSNRVSAAPIKVALVSGANKGIGKEIARGLAKAGFIVLIGARKAELGEATAAELAKDGQVSFQQLDVGDIKSVTAAAAAVKQKYGYLDVLVSPVCVAALLIAQCFQVADCFVYTALEHTPHTYCTVKLACPRGSLTLHKPNLKDICTA